MRVVPGKEIEYDLFKAMLNQVTDPKYAWEHTKELIEIAKEAGLIEEERSDF